MSRLRQLRVPFVGGIDDRVAAAVLPDGALSDLRNGRMTKAGQLALRRGWRPLDMSVHTEGGTQVGIDEVQDLYSTGAPGTGSLVALVRQDGALRLMAYVSAQPTVPWVLRDTAIPPLTDVRAVGNIPDLPTDVVRASAAVTSDGTWGAVLAQTAAVTVLRVFRMATDETVFHDRLTSGADVRKVVSMGLTFGVVRNTGAALTLSKFDPAAAAAGVTTVGTLFSAVVTHFDVAVASETAPTALHITDVVAGEVSYRKFTFAGVQTGLTKQVVASGARSAFIATDETEVGVVYQATATGELSLLSFAATGAFTTAAGPTALDAGVAVLDDRYAIALPATENATYVVAQLATGPAREYVTGQSSHVSISTHTFTGYTLTCGWVVREDVAGFGASRGGKTAKHAVFGDAASPWLVHSYAALSTLATTGDYPFAPGASPSGDVLVFWPRASDATPSVSLGEGSVRTLQVGVQTARVLDTARRQAAVYDGALYLAGGVLSQYVGGGAVENGMLAPVLAVLTKANGSGTLANATYDYRAVLTWRDEAGRLHRSPVSDPKQTTLTGADDTVTATIHVPKTLRRSTLTTPVVELYRTEGGPGELFYLVAAASVSATVDAIDVVDTLPDASILDNRRLYTEGEFGVVSGALDIAMPSASSYVAALRTRLGLDLAGVGVQFSQQAITEEPIAFVQPGISGGPGLAYQLPVQGEVTAVAALDDSLVVGTRTSVYVIDAQGPGPNLAGVGEFSPPARLPTDVGVYDWRSVVEDSAGLWFLAAPGQLYLLPRGQASPAFAGEVAQDRFGAGTVVGAARDIADSTTAWAVDDGGTTGQLVRHDVTLDTWSVDDLPFSPVALATHDDRFFAVDDAGDVWEYADEGTFGDGASGVTAVALSAVSGDVAAAVGGAPGLDGWGRVSEIGVEGEFRTAAGLLVEVSYDQGLSWTSLGTHTVTGLTSGQAFQRQWYPANQRGGKFRLRVTMTPTSTTAEGCRLTGFSVGYVPRSGPSRLDSAKRR